MRRASAGGVASPRVRVAKRDGTIRLLNRIPPSSRTMLVINYASRVARNSAGRDDDGGDGRDEAAERDDDYVKVDTTLGITVDPSRVARCTSIKNGNGGRRSCRNR